MSIIAEQAKYEAKRAKEIAEHYKKNYERVLNATGKTELTIKDEEFWDLTNEYSAQHQELIDSRLDAFKAAEKEQKAKERPERQCEKCGDVIPSEQAVGRRKYCDNCKGSKPTAAKKAAAPKQGNSCRDCGEIIPPTGKRGRPPVRCSTCKSK